MQNIFSLEGLARETGGSVKGDGSVRLRGVATLDAAREGDLAFVTNPRYLKDALSTRASAILCEKEIPGVARPFLICPNPYAALAKVIALFFPAPAHAPGIHKDAWVD